jgi:hypothetical protein
MSESLANFSHIATTQVCRPGVSSARGLRADGVPILRTGRGSSDSPKRVYPIAGRS